MKYPKIITHNNKAYELVYEGKILTWTEEKVKKLKEKHNADLVMRNNDLIRLYEKVKQVDYKEIKDE